MTEEGKPTKASIAAAVRAATEKEERSKSDWRPQDTAPLYTVILACVKKGKQRCPGRPDMYVAPAWKGPTGWVLFGMPPENQRPGEVVELWMPLPALPEGATEADRDHKDHIKPTWHPSNRLDIAPSNATTTEAEGSDGDAGSTESDGEGDSRLRGSPGQQGPPGNL